MEIQDRKKFDFTSNNNTTCFLVSKFIDDTSKKNVLFNLPDSMCFSFGLKELITICEASEEINNRSYLYLTDSFYKFLQKDFILREIDEFAYVNLLRQLKSIVDDKSKTNLSLIKNYMEKTYKIYYKKYIIALQKKLEKIIKEEEMIDLKRLNFIGDIFINELLSMGYTYKYLAYIFNYFYYDNNNSRVFENLFDLISFLFNKNSDTFDMYLPIKKNISSRDINFIEHQFSEQEIIKGADFKNNKYDFDLDDDTYYCHIYFNANDYFRCTEDQLNRVNSIFNFLKFYTNSQISLDFDDKPFIYSKKLGIINRKSIKSMLQYSYYCGTTNVIDNVNDTFEKLDSGHNVILMDIYDIFNYSQKNHDILSNDQFLSKWISLESCASKALNRKGFDSVLEYVTKALTITFYRQKITRILRDPSINCKLEDFIKNFDKDCFKKKIFKIKNVYYKYIIEEYIDILSSNKKLFDSIEESKELLKYMLYRIYFMRNKYVHSGNTINNNDMLRYYLNIIEPFFVDKILKTLNLLINNNVVESDKVTWNDIFSEIDFKFDFLYNSLLLIKEPLNVSKTSKIKLDELVNDNSRKNLIINILVEHSKNLTTVKGMKDYYEDNDDEEEVIIDE